MCDRVSYVSRSEYRTFTLRLTYQHDCKFGFASLYSRILNTITLHMNPLPHNAPDMALQTLLNARPLGLPFLNKKKNWASQRKFLRPNKKSFFRFPNRPYFNSPTQNKFSSFFFFVNSRFYLFFVEISFLSDLNIYCLL